MEFRDYQSQAQKTDQLPGDEGDALIVPLLGMAGEAASLLVEYKKRIRDGEAHRLFRAHLSEELGDLLWYMANLAEKFDLDLGEVAEANLRKVSDRWMPSGMSTPASTMPLLFDEGFPPVEQFPRRMIAEIRETIDEAGRPVASLTVDGRPIGDALRDNSYQDDGYRFHDVLHLGNVALLGWSPTMRGLMRHKRRSDSRVDEVEDGGRAIVIDEGIAAYIFEVASRHDFYDGVREVDYEVLRTIRNMTSGLEVAARSAAEWQHAILTTTSVWRAIRASRGGTVLLDLRERRFELQPTGD